MSVKSVKQEMVSDIQRMLGGSLIDVELNNEDYKFAIKKALEKYRSKSVNAIEESFLFIDFEPDKNTYKLPNEVVGVTAIRRRTLGPIVGSGAELDPFALSYSNLYLLANNKLGIATYEFFTQYIETVGKILGFYTNFKYNETTKELLIFQRPHGNETVLLEISNRRPDELIFADEFALPWIRDWALTEAQMILAHAYRKVGNIPGPNGGTSLPGEQLMSEAKEKQTELLDVIKNYGAGEHQGLSVIIG